MHAKLCRLFLQRRIDVVGDHFDFDAGTTGLVNARAQLLGAVAARIPGLKIEVRRGAHFDCREIAGRYPSCELSGGRNKGNHAAFLFCKRGEMSRQGGGFIRWRERIACGQPYSPEFAINDCAVNLRCGPQERSRRDAHERMRIVAVDRLQT